MKLTSAVLFSVAAADIKTLIGQVEEDKKVPDRHPLQRLWRLYQFSEEFIQEHAYKSPALPGKKLDKVRERIAKWMYLAARQSYLIGTKRCGFYDETKVHGGPTIDENNNSDNNIDNHTIDELSEEQTQLNQNANEYSPDNLDVYNPRPRRDTDDEEVTRYDRDEPCVGVKQIMTGFAKWSYRYIGGCGGQKNHKHQYKRAEKFYNFLAEGLSCPQERFWSPKN